MSSRTAQFAAAAAGIAAALSLLFLVKLPSNMLWQRVSLDASHGPIFAAVAVIVAWWLDSRATRQPSPHWPDWRRLVLAFCITLAIGMAIEFLQSLQDRPPSAFDVLTDAAGAAAGLALWSLWKRPRAPADASRHRDRVWTMVAIALAGMLCVVWRPLQAAIAYAGRAADFPVLAEFMRPGDLHFVTPDGFATAIVELPAPWSRAAGERALKLQFDAAHPPAVQLVEPPHDWRGYSVVAMDLTNAGDAEIHLVFRILDATHDWSHADRFNLSLAIPPRTRTTVRVALSAVEAAPASRPMDLSRIANVMLFGRDIAGPGELYVSRVWLE